MADKPKERNWDREMREVDKLLAKLPDADPPLGRGTMPPPRKPGPEGGIPTVRATPAVDGARGAAVTWLRLGLVLLLGIGMLVWPYSHVCGVRLFFYVLGVLTLIIAGVWSAMAAWKHRQGFAHILALMLVVMGLAYAAGVILPRVGYAGQQALWLCPEPTAPPSPNR